MQFHTRLQPSSLADVFYQVRAIGAEHKGNYLLASDGTSASRCASAPLPTYGTTERPQSLRSWMPGTKLHQLSNSLAISLFDTSTMP